jgi:molecular chaperone DnaJ
MTANHGQYVLRQTVTCRACSGEGDLPEAPCKKCSGTGNCRKNEAINVKIPKGISSGDMLRLQGMGNYDGDLLIFIKIRRHSKFVREENDILCSQEIPFETALAGGKASVLGLAGEEISFDIPRGCRHGHEVVVPGKGICNGSMKVTISYRLPVLSDSQLQKIIPKLNDT